MEIKSPSKLYDFLSLIAGAALPLAFAPFGWFPVAILAPSILLAIWLVSSPWRAFLRGWLFGLGFFGVGISWVFVSIHTYGKTPALIAGLITTVFVMTLALFPALQGYLSNRFIPRNSHTKCLFVFPSLWVLLEWIRGWLLTGFPWLFLGYSQIHSPLKGLGPILGVYGISFAVALTSGLLVTLFRVKNWRWRWMTLGTIILIWGISAALNQIQWTPPEKRQIKISLVQGNIPQTLKWDPKQLQASLQLYINLTLQHLDSKIIVWPEAAITITNQQGAEQLNTLAAKAKSHHATIITGMPIFLGNKVYNGMIAIGNGRGMYLKRHLVPFGEYVPLQKLLRGLINFFNLPMSDLSPGPKKQPLLEANGITMAPFICYEIAYPQEVLNAIGDAKMIVVVTDDSWFGKSIASAQHLQIAQMRALETGRYLLFSTNNGVTAIINSKGNITSKAPKDQEYVLTGYATPRQGKTPLMYMGTYPFIIFLFLWLGGGIFVSTRRKTT